MYRVQWMIIEMGMAARIFNSVIRRLIYQKKRVRTHQWMFITGDSNVIVKVWYFRWSNENFKYIPGIFHLLYNGEEIEVILV